MEIRIAAVGKLRQEFCRSGAEEYLGRLRPYARVTVREVRPGKDELADLARALEGCRAVIVCDPRGRELSSEELARFLGDAMDQSKFPLGIAVGGADGLPPEFQQARALRVSFSRMTFPHELFRVMLLEQLYRAFSILRGEPYHTGH